MTAEIEVIEKEPKLRINWACALVDCVAIICSVWLRSQGFSLWWLFFLSFMIFNTSSNYVIKTIVKGKKVKKK